MELCWCHGLSTLLPWVQGGWPGVPVTLVGALPAPSHAASLPWAWVCPAPASLPGQGLAVPLRSWVSTAERGPDPIYAELCFPGKGLGIVPREGTRPEHHPGLQLSSGEGRTLLQRGHEQQVPSAPCQCHQHRVSAMDTLSVPWAQCQCHQHRVSAMGTTLVPSAPCQCHRHRAAQNWRPLLQREISLSQGSTANDPTARGICCQKNPLPVAPLPVTSLPDGSTARGICCQ